MKVFALMILLVSVYCLEGAIVKREAETPARDELAELGQSVQQFFATVSAYVTREMVPQERIEQLKAQAQTYMQQMQAHVDPLATQVREGLTQMLSGLVETAKKHI
ncbi:apolipoprotein A-II-like [Hemicordylus capensis]|uniref:apolipoprotein A-II-like n=1 Tax=Hemicordylus capensis TaxID=884348 RepID=UPI002303B866|nr:apolipoprotein A-II-like [Hemicordylus capensis]